MDIRLLDLDGGVAAQPAVAALAHRLPLRHWGPRLRLACGWGEFGRFECDLARRLGGTRDDKPALTFIGSGDFHHVSLAMVKRQARPFNLLVLDNHPDWMRRVPLLHCGTWLNHAARLPLVRRVFHAGGEVDFDNYFRWLAPWDLLRSRKIVVFPSHRRFSGWGDVPHEPLRRDSDEPVDHWRLEELLAPWRDELAAHPLHVSLDRDVIAAGESVSNWDHGRLTADEVLRVLRRFLRAAPSVAGMDVAGDWSEVETSGWLRAMLHWAEHPWGRIDGEEARRVNEPVNLAVVEALLQRGGG